MANGLPSPLAQQTDRTLKCEHETVMQPARLGGIASEEKDANDAVIAAIAAVARRGDPKHRPQGAVPPV